MLENRRGKTIFISSHILSEIERTCTRVAIIDHGSMVIEDTMENLRRELRDDVELEVELGSSSPPVEEALRRLEFVLGVEAKGNIVTIRVPAGPDHRAEIAQAVFEAGASLLGLRVHEMSLEDAFVTITERNPAFLTRGRRRCSP